MVSVTVFWLEDVYTFDNVLYLCVPVIRPSEAEGGDRKGCVLQRVPIIDS